MISDDIIIDIVMMQECNQVCICWEVSQAGASSISKSQVVRSHVKERSKMRCKAYSRSVTVKVVRGTAIVGMLARIVRVGIPFFDSI